ncbi:SurA N-terminal domain-containing protein [Pelagibacteraceae bacterium]|nr:SurA N-terminal domain-containing protein [Pelagibacteraceae bacterium]
MLTSIAKISKSFFIKLLVAIIILPFVFWGMGDVFRGGNQNIIATIDSEKIDTQEFMSYLKRVNLTEDQIKNIKETDTLEKVLSEFIGRKIILLEVDRMGIEISDYSLKNLIINNKNFYKNKKFSRTQYEKFLLENAVSAPIFEKSISEQEKKTQLLSYLSTGVIMPSFFVENEFKKENQTKKIEYLDLNNIYKTYIIEKKEIDKIYNENKDIFMDKFKSIYYAKLTPENLIGTNEYNQQFFDKVDNIENDLLDGLTIEDVARKNNLKLSKTKEINRKQIDVSNNKFKNIDNDFFSKVYLNKNKNLPEVIRLKNNYYLYEVFSITDKAINVDSPDVQKLIKSQIRIKNKFENNKKIADDIIKNSYVLKDMENFAKKNNLLIQKIEINNLKDNKIFTTDIIKKIFETTDGSFNLITDSSLSKNYIIFTKKTTYKDLIKKSDDYDKYKLQAKTFVAKDIYNTYDRIINKKYKVELNNKVLDRIKNSF